MSSHTIPTTQTYIQRVQAVAMFDPQRATLTVENGSGHTKLLIVAVGSIKHTVVQLGFKLHKTFNAVVKLAQDWLAGYKALFAPMVAETLLLLPATIEPKTLTELLAIARAAIPEKKPYDWQAWAAKVDAVPATPRSGSFYAGNAGKVKRAIVAGQL